MQNSVLGRDDFLSICFQPEFVLRAYSLRIFSQHTTVPLACKSHLPGPTFFWGKFQKSPFPPQPMVPELKLWKENVGKLEEKNRAFPPLHPQNTTTGNRKGHRIWNSWYRKSLTSQQVTRRNQVCKQSSLIAAHYTVQLHISLGLGQKYKAGTISGHSTLTFSRPPMT